MRTVVKEYTLVCAHSIPARGTKDLASLSESAGNSGQSGFGSNGTSIFDGLDDTTASRLLVYGGLDAIRAHQKQVSLYGGPPSGAENDAALWVPSGAGGWQRVTTQGDGRAVRTRMMTGAPITRRTKVLGRQQTKPSAISGERRCQLRCLDRRNRHRRLTLTPNHRCRGLRQLECLLINFLRICGRG